MKKINYLKGLDGVRALAIVFILIYHYWPTENRVLSGGFIGVEIFFVISGFIITLILLNEWQENNRINLKNFWIHRIRRLFPALAVFMLLTVFLAAILPSLIASIESSKIATLARYIPDFENELSALKYQVVSGFSYVINWYFIFQGKSYFELTDRPPLFGHLWSLSIEGQFYLLWPLILILALKLARNRKNLAVVLCLLFVVVSSLAMAIKGQASPNDTKAYFGTDTRVYSLFIGSILALIFGEIKRFASSKRIRKIALELLGISGLIGIVFLGFTLSGGELSIFRGGLLLVSIATSFVIIAATCFESKFNQVVFENPFMRWIGRRSYSLYLWHWPIFILTEPRYNYQIEGLELMFIRFGILFLATEISYQIIEKPLRSGLIGRIVRRIQTEKGKMQQELAIKAGVPSLVFCALAVFCAISLLTYESKGIPGLAQAMASGSGKSICTNSSSATETATSPDMNTNKQAEIKARASSPSTDVGPAEEEETVQAIAIGDSVMLGAKKALKDTIENLKVDAVVSRQFSEVYRIIKKLKGNGKLPPFVIIHTGTNGTIDEKAFAEMMENLRQCRRVVIFNLRVPRKWEDANNRILKSIVLKHNNAVLIDWNKKSSCQREVFYKDGIHLKHPKGTLFYAQLAKDALTEE